MTFRQTLAKGINRRQFLGCPKNRRWLSQGRMEMNTSPVINTALWELFCLRAAVAGECCMTSVFPGRYSSDTEEKSEGQPGVRASFSVNRLNRKFC